MPEYIKFDGLTRREILKYGLYGGLAAGLPLGLLHGCCKNKKRPNIILITLDTTRADHLSCYGYHRMTSPNLDKLAEESVLYTNAIAPSSWTLPSHASLFTGKFTSSHGAEYDPEGPLHLTDVISGPQEWGAYRARGLARNEVTLAGILKEASYSTGAVVGGPYMNRVFGLNKGFDFYDDSEISSLNGRLANQITESAIKWIDKVRERTFFIFLNYYDPHAPYQPPGDFFWSFLKKMDFTKEPTIEELISLYDGEILFMDHYIGRLLQKIKAEDLYDNTMIIVTADHGELLGEHDLKGHGRHLYQEEIHIPLFIKYPGKEVTPKQTNQLIQLNDIMAIVLNRLGISLPQGIQSGIPPHIGHPVLAETYPLQALDYKDGHWRAILDDKFKFIWNSKNNHMLFNLEDDPREQNNFVSSHPDLLKLMMSKLDQYLEKLPKPGPASEAKEVDEGTIKALKGLGYVK